MGITKWTQFTRRTDDPKLSWLENQLTRAGIAHRRNGESFHAPILEVPEGQVDDAWKLLTPIDDIPDNDPIFTEDPSGCSCGEPGAGLCAFCQVKDAITRMTWKQ